MIRLHLALPALLFAAALLPSCGPSEGGSEKKTASIENRLQAAENLLEEAKGKGAEAAFAGSPFVRLVDGTPRVAAVTGSNFCDVAVTAKDGAGVVMSALDNLVKGMAGQAIQCMNLALGLEETAGLKQPGCWP